MYKVCFSVGAGLICGKEGPLVYILLFIFNQHYIIIL